MIQYLVQIYLSFILFFYSDFLQYFPLFKLPSFIFHFHFASTSLPHHSCRFIHTFVQIQLSNLLLILHCKAEPKKRQVFSLVKSNTKLKVSFRREHDSKTIKYDIDGAVSKKSKACGFLFFGTRLLLTQLFARKNGEYNTNQPC